jgi:large-conductance mechanosensitive channel
MVAIAIWQDFVKYLKKHDALSLAIGVLIAKSLSGLTNSIVKDLVRPTLDPPLSELKKKLGTDELIVKWWFIRLNLGSFIENLIEFLILGLTIVTITEIAERIM